MTAIPRAGDAPGAVMTSPGDALPDRHAPTRLAPGIIALLALLAGIAPVAQAQPAGGDQGDGNKETAPLVDAAAEGPWMDGVAVDRQERARALFLEGNDLAREAFFGDAAAKYREALEIWDHPAFHFNLAMTQRLLDQPLAAYASLGKAMRYGAPPLGEGKYQHAERMREQLASKLSRIEVVCDEPEARVTFDGTLLFVGPGRHASIVKPGEHQLVASKEGYIPDTRPISLAPGKKESVSLRLRRAGSNEIELERRWPAWIPYTVASTSVIFLATGTFVARQAGDKFNTFDDDFDPLCDQGCDEDQLAAEVQETLDKGESQRNLGRVVFAGGMVILATGAVLIYLNQPRPVESHSASKTSKADDHKETGKLSIAPYVTPDGAGVSAGLRF